MTRLAPRTFDGKLRAVVFTSTMTALVLSLAGIAVYQYVTGRQSLVREMGILADVVGQNASAALAFRDPTDGERLISAVRAKPHIVAAYLLTPERVVLASYETGDPAALPAITADTGFARGTFIIERDVVRDTDLVGSIRLVSSRAPVTQQLRDAVTAGIAIFLGCALLALVAGYRWLSLVSRPIHSLVGTAARISGSRDYSLRAVRYEDDDLGRLTDAFNRMLEQIETSDRELQHANLELARSNADLERFAYVASHDLQEPLRIVTSYSELLEDAVSEDLEPDSKKYLGYVVSASKRMRTMIQALLEYSRVGTRGARFDPADCEKALDAALENLHLLIDDCGAEIRRHRLPTVLGDRHQITLLFQNLIANALKFRRDGVAPRIEVASRPLGEMWELSVADNGIGMDPGSTGDIFEVFHRLHSRSEYPGTGIGLAICRRIAERHDGEIRVRSAPGVGSTFFFSLPRVGYRPASGAFPYPSEATSS